MCIRHIRRLSCRWINLLCTNLIECQFDKDYKLKVFLKLKKLFYLQPQTVETLALLKMEPRMDLSSIIPTMWLMSALMAMSSRGQMKSIVDIMECGLHRHLLVMVSSFVHISTKLCVCVFYFSGQNIIWYCFVICAIPEIFP